MEGEEGVEGREEWRGRDEWRGRKEWRGGRRGGGGRSGRGGRSGWGGRRLSPVTKNHKSGAFLKSVRELTNEAKQARLVLSVLCIRNSF